MSYYVHVDGETVGPLRIVDVLERASADTLVSLGQKWVRLGDHPDFSGLTQEIKRNPIEVSRSHRSPVTISSLRVSGEQFWLGVALLLSAALFFFFTTISLGVFLFLMALAVVMVKVQQGKILGGCVRVNGSQFERINSLCDLAASRLNMNRPDVFVMQDPTLNAFAIGTIGKKSVVLNSALVEGLSDDELLYIIGHEFTHVKLGHTVWLTFMGQAQGIGVPILSDIFSLIFNVWSRRAEYSSDRGGLVAAEDERAGVAALSKLAVGSKLFDQMNHESFSHQKNELEDDGVTKFSELLAGHPFTVNRVHEIHRFAKAEGYCQRAAA